MANLNLDGLSDLLNKMKALHIDKVEPAARPAPAGELRPRAAAEDEGYTAPVFSGVELKPFRAPDAVPAPKAITLQVNEPAPTVNVDQSARETALKGIALAKSFGLDPGHFRYHVGSRVEVTDAGYQRVREAFYKRPTVERAIAEVVNKIRGEGRQDILIDPASLIFETSGHVRLEGRDDRWALDGPAALNHVFGELIHGVPAGGLAASLVRREREEEARQLFELLEKRDREVYMRTRENGGKSMFAIVSQDYAKYDVDEFLGDLKDALESQPEARAELDYDGRRLKGDILFFHDHKEPCTGDAFQCGFRVTAADDKTCGIMLAFVVHFNACLNYLCINKPELMLMKLKHTGNKDEFRLKINAAVGAGLLKVGKFQELWAERSRDLVISKHLADGPRKLFTELIEGKHVWMPGVAADVLLERCLKAWEKAPGYNRTSVIQAITRMSHENTWGNVWATSEMEEQAGNLLYVRRFPVTV